MSDTEENGELGGSELGTKEYWESAYEEELKNFKDHGDVGEVWFGEDIALRVIRWMCNSDRVHNDDSIVDLGCGNGMMLIELAREGFNNLTGVDYSERAVSLAKLITVKQELPIKYQVCDLLSKTGINSVSVFPEGKFKVVLDKGTYDAVSLHPDEPREKRLTYLSSVHYLLAPGGLFIITSCNWTEDELVSHLNSGFQLVCPIPTPKFQFGGKMGNLVTSLVFERI